MPLSFDIPLDEDGDPDPDEMTPEQLREFMLAEAIATEPQTDVEGLIARLKAQLPLFNFPPLFVSREQCNAMIETFGNYYQVDFTDQAVAEQALRITVAMGEWQVAARGLGMSVVPAQQFWVERIIELAKPS